MRSIVILTLTLLLGYSSMWIGELAVILNQNNVTDMGTLNDFKEECSLTSDISTCTNKYVIPLNETNKNATFGLGIIISSSVIYCDNDKKNAIYYDDYLSPGKRFDLMNLYQTVDLSTLECKNYLNIESWSKKGSVRIGFQEGPLLYGNRVSIQGIKRSFEFYSKEVHRLIAVSLFLIALLYLLMSYILKQNIQNNIFSSSISSWLLFLFFASDLFQTILPISNLPFFINKIVAAFSLAAHFIPFIDLAFLKSKKYADISSTQKNLASYIIFVPLMFSSYWLNIFYSTFLLVSIAYFILGIKRRSLQSILFGVISTLVYLKMKNIPFTLSAMSTSYFVGFSILLSLVENINKLSSFVSNILYLDNSAETEDINSIDTIEERLFEIFPANKITFLKILHGNGCEITVYRKQNNTINKEVFHRESLPPIFAYCISKENDFWHLQDDTAFMKQLNTKKVFKDEYHSNYFTMIPLKDNGNTWGAIAFTEYSTAIAKDEFKTREIKNHLDIFIRIYTQKRNEYIITKKNEHKDILDELDFKITEIEKCINNTNKEVDSNLYLEKYFRTLTEHFECHGYIGALEPDTRRVNILSCIGYPEDIRSRIINGKIYANKENKYGPLPVSINEKRTVIIPDITLWKDLLHEYTMYFFKRCGTNSCTAIPIYSKDQVWGAMFLEQSSEDRFTESKRNIFDYISKRTSKFISLLDLKSIEIKTKQVLTEFIPDHAVESLISEGSYEERDEGYLIMIDLCSSTKISNRLGEPAWEKAMKEVLDSLNQVELYGFQLAEFKWDAIFLTMKCQKIDQITNILKLLTTELKPMINEVYSKHFGPEFPEFLNPNTNKARICLVYGDITRGVMPGPQKSWTFTGKEIANVIKLEDEAKALMQDNPYSLIFTDSSTEVNINWIKTSRTVPSNNRDIYILSNYSWSDIPDKQDLEGTKAA